MATHAGSEGIVKISDVRIAEVKSWNIDEVCDTVDASIIGTSWRKNMATIRSWSGSLDAFWDESDAGGQNHLRLGSIVEMKLYAAGEDDGSNYFSGTAIITGISRQASFDGLVESSFSFQGNGELKELKHVVPELINEPADEAEENPREHDDDNENNEVNE